MVWEERVHRINNSSSKQVESMLLGADSLYIDGSNIYTYINNHLSVVQDNLSLGQCT